MRYSTSQPLKRFAAIVLAAGLAACGGAAPASSAPVAKPSSAAPSRAPARIIEVDATDFAFNTPETIEGGWVTLRMRNSGQEPHHLSLRKLNDGVTFDQIIAVARQGDNQALGRLARTSSGVWAHQLWCLSREHIRARAWRLSGG